MKKLVLTLCVLAVTATTTTLRAQAEPEVNPIFTGIHSLIITPDARAGGMGDVGVATHPDIFSQHWNPAKYAFMESPAGFGFSYTPWLRALVDDIGLFYMAGFWRLDNFQAFSASVRYFSLGTIRMMQHAQDPGIDARPNEFAIDLAYSRRLSETLSASVAFRYIRGDLNVPPMIGGEGGDMYPAHAFAVDVSAFYTRPITMASGDGILSFGTNISNIGNRVTYDRTNYNFLPTAWRLGGSFDMPFDNFNRLSISADASRLLVISRRGEFLRNRLGDDFYNPVRLQQEFNQTGPLQSIFGSFVDGNFAQRIIWSIGAEYAYNQQFFVRAGYHHEHINQGGRSFFTAGAGFRLNVFQLDAAYVIAAPANPLNSTLRFSLSFDMDGLRALMN